MSFSLTFLRLEFAADAKKGPAAVCIFTIPLKTSFFLTNDALRTALRGDSDLSSSSVYFSVQFKHGDCSFSVKERKNDSKKNKYQLDFG